jgi:spore coat polysaccharide biosynthesis protein SpsF
MSITAIIQARLNSTRLPKKVLLPFGERTVLDEVIYQVGKSIVDRVHVAVPEDDYELWKLVNSAPGNDKSFCNLWHGIADDDLISRYYLTACEHHADPIVRITSDCPLILPEVIDLVIKAHFENAACYTFNRCDNAEGGWPDGLDVEVVDFAALQNAYVLADEREDFQWIRNRFENYQVPCDKDYGECTSINTKEDYIKALEILSNRQ